MSRDHEASVEREAGERVSERDDATHTRLDEVVMSGRDEQLLLVECADSWLANFVSMSLGVDVASRTFPSPTSRIAG
jgi:hypothetical protein